MTDDERPTLAAITAMRDTQSVLHTWWLTAHNLVHERQDAIKAVDPRWGPHTYLSDLPIPRGYDDYPTGYYEHVSVGYGTQDDPTPTVHYEGRWTKWAADRESYEKVYADITIPAWVITDPDGPDRYRAQTAGLVAAEQAKFDEWNAQIDRVIRAALTERQEEDQ